MTTPPGKPGRAPRQWTHWAAAGCAVAALPTAVISPLWVLLFSLPGLAFMLLSRPRFARRLTFADRLALATLIDGALAVAIFQTPATPTPQAALTYLLIAPLAFTALRQQDLDVLHCLFLSLCLTLIGTILQPELPLAQVIGFGVFATLALQTQAANPTLRGRTFVAVARRPRWNRTLHRLSVTLACLSASVGIFEIMRHLPPPGGRQSPAAPTTAAHVGVSPNFELDGQGSGPLQLIDDELLEVRAAPNTTPPADLYLRCGVFDIASPQRWTLRTRRRHETNLARSDWIGRPIKRLAHDRLLIHRVEGVSGMIYVPPGTYQVSNVRGTHTVTWDATHQLFRETAPSGPITYAVHYQDARRLARRQVAATEVAGMTRLPRSLRSRQLRDLAHRWGNHPTATVPEIADAIAAGLRDRCHYSLSAPTGEHDNMILNFLFGSRNGYCMHYASAMAVLLRLRGVPCRIAVGLYGGDGGSTHNERRFGSRDAHAWVEIPFRELGWVVFDPTPESALVSRNGRWPELTTATTAGDEDRQSAGGLLDWADALPVGLVWPWFVVAALLLGMWFAPGRRRQPKARAEPLPTEGRHARRLLAAILHALATRGIPRRTGQSLERYLTALEQHAEVDTAAIGGAFRAYQDVRFGRQPLDEARRRQLLAGRDAASNARR